jgi:hypothetical protein
MTTPPTAPDVPLPAGAHTLSTWEDWDNEFRILWGEGRRVEATNILLSPCAAQLPDGSIDTGGTVADEPAQVMIDELRDGNSYDCLSVSVQGTRNLAQALIEGGRRARRVGDTMTTRTDAHAFEAVIAGWDEAIACQSVHGCSGQATWLAVTHKPCGGPKSICAEHVLRWMGEAMEVIAEGGEMQLPGL